MRRVPIDSYRFLEFPSRQVMEAWAAREEPGTIPFTPLRKPLGECTVALVSPLQRPHSARRGVNRAGCVLVYDALVNLMEEISRRFSSDPKIAALALFGSRALGSAREDSDLDVAVLPASGDSEERRYLQADLATALCDLVPSGRVDVVLLDEAPDVLRQRVFEHGKVLVLRDPGAWRALRVRTMREYGDREPYREILRQGLRRRLLSQETEDGRPGSAVRSLERLGRLSRRAE